MLLCAPSVGSVGSVVKASCLRLSWLYAIALKRRAGVTSPPMGAYERINSTPLLAKTCIFGVRTGVRPSHQPQCAGADILSVR